MNKIKGESDAINEIRSTLDNETGEKFYGL